MICRLEDESPPMASEEKVQDQTERVELDSGEKEEEEILSLG